LLSHHFGNYILHPWKAKLGRPKKSIRKIRLSTCGRGFISQSYTTRPGEILIVQWNKKILKNILASSKKKDLILHCGKKQFPIYESSDRYFSFYVESYFSKKRKRHCLFHQQKILSIEVAKKVFPSEKLKVQPRKISPHKKDIPRIQKEQSELNRVYANSAKELFINGKNVMVPLDSKITSIYGIQRLYNKVKKGQHLGTDFRAPIGTPIPVMGKGKVVLAKSLFFTGFTVIVDHGLGLFSTYGHLDKLQTTVGKMVEKGEIVGLAGMTGRASGPHLHWGIKLYGEWIDGIQVIEALSAWDHWPQLSIVSTL